MPTPAIRKVQDQVKARLLAARPDLFVFIDRSEDEPLDDTELPGVVIRVTELGFIPFEMQGQTRVDFSIQFDCLSDNTAAGTIDLVNQTTVADIVAMIAIDRTLGGMVNDLEEGSASGSERAGADIGSAILEASGFFFTPRGDLYTIVGAGGQLF